MLHRLLVSVFCLHLLAANVAVCGGSQRGGRRPQQKVNAEKAIKKLLRQHAIPAPHYLDEEEPQRLPPPKIWRVNQTDRKEGEPPFPLPQPRDENGTVGVPDGVRRFMVLTTQRSGSGWLLHKLESRYPHIRADPSEPFIGPKHAFGDPDYNVITEQQFRYLLDRTLLRRCGMKEWQPRELACGFKFMYNQIPSHIPDVVVMEWAKENDVAIIHLIRQNILRNIISKALLTRDQDEHQGNAHVRSNDPQLTGVVNDTSRNETLMVYNNSRQIRLPYPRNSTWDDATALQKFSNRVRFDIKDINNWRRLLLEHRPGDHIEVSYESLMASDHQCSAVLAFLHPLLAHFSCQDLDSRGAIQKQHTGKTCSEYVENWQDIRNTILELMQESDLKPMLLYAVRMCKNKE